MSVGWANTTRAKSISYKGQGAQTAGRSHRIEPFFRACRPCAHTLSCLPVPACFSHPYSNLDLLKHGSTHFPYFSSFSRVAHLGVYYHMAPLLTHGSSSIQTPLRASLYHITDTDSRRLIYIGNTAGPSDEDLSWMFQAMDMVCSNTYAGVHALICRRKKPLRLVRYLSVALCARR